MNTTANTAVKKMSLGTLLVVTALALPTLAIAQAAQAAQGGLTRAQVRAEVVQLEAVGYFPGRRDPNYPAQIQAAEMKIHEQKMVDHSAGGSVMGTVQTGNTVAAAVSPTANRGRSADLFSHH